MAYRFDFDKLNSIDLALLIEEDLGPAARHTGGHYVWLCPFHDDHHPSFDLNEKKNAAFCNVCAKAFRPMSWLMEKRGLDWRAAAELLEAKLGLPQTRTVRVQAAPADKPYAPPPTDWQQAAAGIVAQGVATLWDNSPASNTALAWLEARGLLPTTLAAWQVGYLPRLTRINDLWVQSGILIPCYMDGQLWGIKIRLLDGHSFLCAGCGANITLTGPCPQCGKKNKYRSVLGSQPALFGANTCQGRRVVFGCEGEFDAMATWQEAGDLGGVFTSTNGAGKDWRPEWFGYVLDAERVITLYDNDAAGDTGRAKVEALGKRVRSVSVPGECKDITDYHLTGRGKLFSWLCMVRRCALEAAYTPAPDLVQWLPTMKITPVLPGLRAEAAELAALKQRLSTALPPTLRADYERDIDLLERILQTEETHVATR